MAAVFGAVDVGRVLVALALVVSCLGANAHSFRDPRLSQTGLQTPHDDRSV
jgi:hypothetical protein